MAHLIKYFRAARARARKRPSLSLPIHGERVKGVKFELLSFSQASIEAWKKRVDETVMTDDSARFGKYRRQLDELSAAITQLHRR